MVFAPALIDIDSEREVVLEEIAMVEDNPQDLVHDLAAEAVFGTHPLGRPVIGSADVIASISRRALMTYHRGVYVGANVVLAAAGNVDHNRFVKKLAKRRNGNGAVALRRKRRPAGATPRPGVRFQRKKTEQYHVCLAGPGLKRDDPRRYAAALLDAILGGSASSRLFQEIREKRGMAYSVYTFASQYTDSGLIGFYVGTRPENLADCLEIASEQIAEVANGGLRKGELERAKENLKGRILLSMESTSNRMSRLGKSLVSDTELLSIDRIAAEIDAVTPDAVAELAGLLLAPERLSASGIGPSEERFRDAVRRITPELPARAAA